MPRRKSGPTTANNTALFKVRRNRPSRDRGGASGRPQDGQASAWRETRCWQSGHAARVVDAIVPSHVIEASDSPLSRQDRPGCYCKDTAAAGRRNRSKSASVRSHPVENRARALFPEPLPWCPERTKPRGCRRSRRGGSGGSLAHASGNQEVGVEQDLIARAGSSERTVRCFTCRNRIGLAGAVVLESGVVCCHRCGQGATSVVPPARRGTSELRA